MKRIMHRETVTRDTQQADVLYVGPENDNGDRPAFVTPDGEGRYWFDTIEEAREQYGDDMPTCYLDVMPDD